jgi:hypothetical protein
MHRKLFLAAALLGLAAPAHADDSTAALGTGGLVLERNDKVALRAEDLYLSSKEIRISYHFLNKTNQDVPVTIAFPMPDITGDVNFTVAVPDAGADNFLKFETKVDGKPVASQVEQRAFYKAEGKPEIEITAELKALGLPMMPTAAGAALNALPAGKRQPLIDKGYVAPDTYDAGKGWQTDYVGMWTMRSKFYRQQVFPAGKEVLVEQRYQPSLGALAGTIVGTDSFQGEEKARYLKTWCTDDDFLRGAKTLSDAMAKDTAGNHNVNEQYLSYVITSGGNWAGPIGDFRLVIDKGYSDNLVSFCGEGVKKIAPTQFELRLKDYVPKRDIDVLILQRHFEP